MTPAVLPLTCDQRPSPICIRSSRSSRTIGNGHPGLPQHAHHDSTSWFMTFYTPYVQRYLWLNDGASRRLLHSLRFTTARRQCVRKRLALRYYLRHDKTCVRARHVQERQHLAAAICCCAALGCRHPWTRACCSSRIFSLSTASTRQTIAHRGARHFQIRHNVQDETRPSSSSGAEASTRTSRARRSYALLTTRPLTQRDRLWDRGALHVGRNKGIAGAGTRTTSTRSTLSRLLISRHLRRAHAVQHQATSTTTDVLTRRRHSALHANMIYMGKCGMQQRRLSSRSTWRTSTCYDGSFYTSSRSYKSSTDLASTTRIGFHSSPHHIYDITITDDYNNRATLTTCMWPT